MSAARDASSGIEVASISLSPDAKARIERDVRWLSDEHLGGRRAGEPGEQMTVEWIAKRFADLGLTPFGDAPETSIEAGMETHCLEVSAPCVRRYAHSFWVGEQTSIGDAELTLSVRGAKIPISVSQRSLVDGAASGTWSSGLVFVGWGLSAVRFQWDDYGDVDVRDKIVVARLGAPPPLVGVSDAAQAVSTRGKIRTARERGARAILFVAETDELPDSPLNATSAGLPAIVIARSRAKPLLELAGDAPDRWRDRTSRPARALEGAEASVRTSVLRPTKSRPASSNVLAVLPGRGTTNEWVVLGAHHDHVGDGESDGHGQHLSYQPGAIHPGADDNASGVSLLLEVARTLRDLRPKRNIVFAAFGAEELGLHGSLAWLDRAPVRAAEIKAMVNTDMVGRLRDNQLTFLAPPGRIPWTQLVDTSNVGLRLEPVYQLPSIGSSDHLSFQDADIPAALVFTGYHPEYHRPTDTADTVDFDGLVTVTTFTARLVWSLANQ